MTLVELASDLEIKIRTFVEAKSLAAEARRFETRAQQFSGLALKYRVAKDQGNSFLAAGIAKSADLEAPVSATQRTMLLQVMKRFTENKQTLIASPPNLDATLITPLENAAVTWQMTLESLWKSAVLQALGDFPHELINIFESIPEFAKQVRVLQKIEQQGAVIAATLPGNSCEQIEASLAIVRELRNRKTEALVDLEGVPEDTRIFMRLAVTRKASLCDLTATTRLWLSERNLLSMFRVTI